MLENSKLYNKYLYKIDLYIIKNKMKKKEKVKEKYKNKNITDIDKAIKFLKKQKNGETLFYAYAYSLSDKLKTNCVIYKILKEKFVFDDNKLLNNYSRNFVHEYGEACGKSFSKNKVNECLTEIKFFINNNMSLYAYWMFYSLDSKHQVPFKDYYEIYNMFKDNETVQGYLIGEFTHRGKYSRTSEEYIKLLEKTSDEVLKDNYYMILTRWYYDSDIYNYLLKRGMEKEQLDKQVNEYLERYETLKEKAQNNNLTSDEKKDYQKYIALYYRVIQEDYDINDPVYNYFKDKKEMNYIKDDNLYKSYIKSEIKKLQKEFEQAVMENKPFHPYIVEKVGDQRSIIEYLDEKSNAHPTVIRPSEIVKGIQDGMSINDESGLELAQSTSEHILEKFGITNESFHQFYVDNKGFNTTMNNSCDIDSAIEEFVEKGPVKKLTKKDNINIIK